MLLVASETGHVYTFATRKLQPMITSESGKALIQTCLNSPDPATTHHSHNPDQRMSATGFEETELTYQVSEEELAKVCNKKDCIFVVAIVSYKFHIGVVCQNVPVSPFFIGIGTP